MSTEIEFYQRLSEHLPEEAAKLIAERIAGAERLEAKIDTLATAIQVERMRSSFFRWNLVFFVPLWIGVYATLVAMVLRGMP